MHMGHAKKIKLYSYFCLTQHKPFFGNNAICIPLSLLWWLRQKRDDGVIKAVAVFLGTTIRLGNLYPDKIEGGKLYRH